MNNLVLRIITALIGAGVIIGSIFYSAEAFAFIFILTSTLTHYEYIRTVWHNSNKSPIFEMLYGLIVGLLFIVFRNSILFDQPIFKFLGEFWIILLIGFLIAEIFYNREKPFQQIGLNVLGIYYVPFAFGTFIQCGITADTTVQIWFVMGLLFMVWFNDSFAYFAGRLFGKRKLFERISPKKTWEGFFGGLIMTIICGLILSQIFPELTQIQWVIWSVLVVVAGTLGDLAESLLKRSIQIKDSSSLLPGHGGFLDRFDAFLVVVPVSATYLSVLAYFNWLPA